MGGLYGLIIFNLPAYADDRDLTQSLAQDQSLTLLREYKPDGALNGSFEAKRRAWLASVRAKMKKANPDPDNIEIEELEDTMISGPNELPKEPLKDFMEQIKSEIEMAELEDNPEN